MADSLLNIFPIIHRYLKKKSINESKMIWVQAKIQNATHNLNALRLGFIYVHPSNYQNQEIFDLLF